MFELAIIPQGTQLANTDEGDTGSQGDSFSDLSEKLQNLQEEYNEICEQYDIVDESVKQTVEILNEANRELAEEVDTLATFLQAQIDIANDEDPDPSSIFGGDFNFDSDDDEDDDEDISQKDAAEKAVISNRDLRRHAKLLFRKIANLSHPDKVKHTRFIHIYQEAKEAAERLDIATLEDLLTLLRESKSKVKSRREDARAKLLLRIRELEHKLELKTAEFRELLNSDEYAYAQLFSTHGKYFTVNEHASDLKRSRNYFRSELTRRGIDPDNLPI